MSVACAASPRPRVSLPGPGGGSGPTAILTIGGAQLRVRVDPARRDRTDAEILRWVERAARMVADYCGGFPVPDLDVRIRTGAGLGWGTHTRGRRVMAVVGRRTSARALERDWVLVHEMLHLAFPDLHSRHRWMREGLSTYLETVVRARSRIVDEAWVWRRWTRRMPSGLPRPSDRGLDHTRTWGARYWGGALYWLMVDAEVRARTDNARSIRDVVRGVLARGGNSRQRWTAARVMRVADEATGTTAPSELYEAHARSRGEVDLSALWARLGVRPTEEGVVFDEDAPWAHVRRAMNAPDGPGLPPVAGASYPGR